MSKREWENCPVIIILIMNISLSKNAIHICMNVICEIAFVAVLAFTANRFRSCHVSHVRNYNKSSVAKRK